MNNTRVDLSPLNLTSTATRGESIPIGDDAAQGLAPSSAIPNSAYAAEPLDGVDSAIALELGFRLWTNGRFVDVAMPEGSFTVVTRATHSVEKHGDRFRLDLRGDEPHAIVDADHDGIALQLVNGQLHVIELLTLFDVPSDPALTPPLFDWTVELEDDWLVEQVDRRATSARGTLVAVALLRRYRTLESPRAAVEAYLASGNGTWQTVESDWFATLDEATQAWAHQVVVAMLKDFGDELHLDEPDLLRLATLRDELDAVLDLINGRTDAVRDELRMLDATAAELTAGTTFDDEHLHRAASDAPTSWWGALAASEGVEDLE